MHPALNPCGVQAFHPVLEETSIFYLQPKTIKMSESLTVGLVDTDRGHVCVVIDDKYADTRRFVLSWVMGETLVWDSYM